MLRLVFCLLMGYVALAVGMAGDFGALRTAAPAICMTIATGLLSPKPAVAYAFLLGLGADALGTGPLGPHAALLMLLSAWQLRGRASGGRTSIRRPVRLIGVAVWCDALLPVLIEFAADRNVNRLESELLRTAFPAALCAAATLICVAVGRSVSAKAPLYGDFV